MILLVVGDRDRRRSWRCCSSGSRTGRCATRRGSSRSSRRSAPRCSSRTRSGGSSGPSRAGTRGPTVLDGTVDDPRRPASRGSQIVVFVTAIVAMVALQLFVHRSRTGRSMRAVAEDSEIASLMGIDVDRVVVITFVDRRDAGGGRRRALSRSPSRRCSSRWASGRASRPSRPPCSAASAASAGAALGGFLLGAAASGRAVAVPHRVRHPERVLRCVTRSCSSCWCWCSSSGRAGCWAPARRRRSDARRRCARASIAGIVTVFFAAVGLIGNFTDLNLIGEVVTFALLMIAAPADRGGLRRRRAPAWSPAKSSSASTAQAATFGAVDRRRGRGGVRRVRGVRRFVRGRAGAGGVPEHLARR